MKVRRCKRALFTLEPMRSGRTGVISTLLQAESGKTGVPWHGQAPVRTCIQWGASEGELPLKCVRRKGLHLHTPPRRQPLRSRPVGAPNGLIRAPVTTGSAAACCGRHWRRLLRMLED
eukprot:4854194-Alexandrium_andersonii.AAC.1